MRPPTPSTNAAFTAADQAWQDAWQANQDAGAAAAAAAAAEAARQALEAKTAELQPQYHGDNLHNETPVTDAEVTNIAYTRMCDYTMQDGYTGQMDCKIKEHLEKEQQQQEREEAHGNTCSWVFNGLAAFLL